MQGRWLLTAFCLVIAVMLLFPVSLLAAGVGIAPRELEFNTYLGSSANETLYVINTGDSEAEYEIYVDEEYKDWFDIAPSEFTLVPAEVKEVEVIASPPLPSHGDYAIRLYIIAANPSLQLGVGTGVKVPVQLHIASWPLYVAIGIVALLVGLAVFLVRRRNRAY